MLVCPHGIVYSSVGKTRKPACLVAQEYKSWGDLCQGFDSLKPALITSLQKSA